MKATDKCPQCGGPLANGQCDPCRKFDDALLERQNRNTFGDWGLPAPYRHPITGAEAK
jgi:hypothetical protein